METKTFSELTPGTTLAPLRLTHLGRRQRALLAGRGRRPPGAGRAAPSTRRSPRTSRCLCFAQALPGRDDPDPPAPALPPPRRGRAPSSSPPGGSRGATTSAGGPTSTCETTVATADAPDEPVWTSEVVVHARRDARRLAMTEPRTRRSPSPKSSCARTRAAATTTPTLRCRPTCSCPDSSPRACRPRARRTALLLDEWGEEFLAHGEIEMRFVGMVLAGDTVEARRRRRRRRRDLRGREHDRGSHQRRGPRPPLGRLCLRGLSPRPRPARRGHGRGSRSTCCRRAAPRRR